MRRQVSCEFNLEINYVQLIYNTTLEYANLILNGEVEGYLKRVKQYRPLEEQE